MRPAISPVMDIQTQKNFAAIREALCGGLSFDNMNIRVLEGTTSDTVDTQKMLQHSMNPRPIAWFPLVGDVYVQEISNKFIDIRSTKPGVNFKIILLGGAPVTGESLVAIGNDNYTPTTTEDTFARTSDVGFGTYDILQTKGFDGVVQHVISTPSYYFLTKNSASGLKNQLIRVDKTTGELSALTVSGAGVKLGPLYYDGTYVWTTEKSTSINLYCINPSTMTVVSTVANGLATAITNVADIIVSGNVTWLLGSTGTWGVGSPYLGKIDTNTGAAIGRVLPAGAVADGYGACQLSQDTDYIYFVNYHTPTGHINFNKVAKTLTGNVAVTGAAWSYTSWGVDSQANTSIYYNGYIYTVVLNSAPVLEVSNNQYSYSLVEYDIINGTFSQYPLFSHTSEFNKATDGPMSVEIKQHSNYLYIIGTGDASINPGVCLNIFNLTTKRNRATIYPLYLQNNINLTLFTVNSCMVIDEEFGGPVLVRSAARSSGATAPTDLTTNFCYPDLNPPTNQEFFFI